MVLTRLPFTMTREAGLSGLLGARRIEDPATAEGDARRGAGAPEEASPCGHLVLSPELF